MAGYFVGATTAPSAPLRTSPPREGVNRAAASPAQGPRKKQTFNPNYQQNNPYLGNVLKRLAANDLAAVSTLLDDLEVKGHLSRNVLHSCIRLCAKTNNHHAAIWCAERMRQSGIKLTTVTINSVIDACAKTGDLNQATAWWQVMEHEGIQPNRISYNTMLKACAHARDAKKAEWWIHHMISSGLRPCLISYSTMIDAWSKTGNLAKAEAWFQKMEEAGQQPDAVIYNSLIHACAKAGKPVKAEQLLQRMCEQGIKADEKTYNSVINACAKGGAIQKAEYWFRHMDGAGCRVDEITVGAVMNASAKVGDVDRVEYYMQEMPRRGLRPNVVCYNTVLHACAQIGDHIRALKWFNALKSAGLYPNKISYNSLIDTFMKVGDLDSAECWLRTMVNSGVHVDTITYFTLARDFQHINEHCASQEASRWAFALIIKTYAAEGNMKALGYWLTEMSREGLTLSAEQIGNCMRVSSPVVQGMLMPHWRASVVDYPDQHCSHLGQSEGSDDWSDSYAPTPPQYLEMASYHEVGQDEQDAPVDGDQFGKCLSPASTEDELSVPSLMNLVKEAGDRVYVNVNVEQSQLVDGPCEEDHYLVDGKWAYQRISV
eukprot:CAMPEP_0176153406 /NCGR_PEP_ID=MMETSP0120_2-20121206/78366_1 /TAXON_ID=160619 /ORGANISM="Kryptoperidinium foliaceum, Strain CCMP 1326" /LENGTH=600 /DNA_ID=CAMNT_0017490465 /DNA_START=33 /DNA_END=1835 /DNA_ORIENTATION=-